MSHGITSKDQMYTVREKRGAQHDQANVDAMTRTAMEPGMAARGCPPATRPRGSRGADELHIRPIGLRAANAFVAEHHRHHGPTRGHKFSICVADAWGQIRGVAIAGRPVARELDDGAHLEVVRVCTDGTPNACSMLYGAVRRAAKAMGYPPDQVITYTLGSESGASLRAAGWRLAGCTEGGSWDRPRRSRVDSHPTEKKLRWLAS